MQITVKKTEKKRLDKFGNEIKNPVVLAEIERIEQKKLNNEYLTAKEKMNLAKLTKYGDNSTAKNKLGKTEKKKPAERRLNLASSRELTIQEIDSVIGDIFQGISPAESLANHNISPRAFYTYLKSPSINEAYYDYVTEEQRELYKIQDIHCTDSSSALLAVFSQAREVYAESCFGQLTELNKELKAGQIDSSSYNAITYNLRWIMSKLFPAQYAEKIAVAQDLRVLSKQELDMNKVKELASLIS